MPWKGAINRLYLALAAAGLLVVLATAVFQPAPGYMDAQYYHAGALQLYRGQGFSEMLLWNYLDDPAGLPHPSHGYWMPLVSLLAACGMKLAGSEAFAYSRLLPGLFAVLLPPATAALAFRISKRYDLAALSGLLAVFSGFYLPFISLTDSFSLVMLLGLIFFAILVGSEQTSSPRQMAWSSLLLGLLSGLMHLSRADGFLWLFYAFGFLTFAGWGILESRQWKTGLAAFGLCAAGYLIIMAPWFWRNLLAFGSLLSPGNSRTLWLLDYNDLYTYPAGLLTFQRWWESGLMNLLAVRWAALKTNLASLLLVQGEIFLLPLAFLGLWRLRTWKFVSVAGFAWGITFLLMTFVFPFAGARGGYFHSAASLQPLIWLAAPVGLDVFLTWAAGRRGWQLDQARRVFQVGVAVLAVMLSLGIFAIRVYGFSSENRPWGAEETKYIRLEQALQDYGLPQESIVMVNNPPGYFAATNRPAIAIPNADLQTVMEAAQRYKARILLLEIDQIPGASDLFNNPRSQKGLNYLATVEQVQIYAFANP